MNAFAHIGQQCDAIEECYEFMLAYAAQGIGDDRQSRHGSQLRELLARAVDAAAGIPEAYAGVLTAVDPATAPKYIRFLEVLKADTSKALAAMELVLVQSRMPSQLIDNLNASVHLRTLLADIFLLDEILRLQQTP
ncbi:MAG: hypothetical protein LBD10_06185 [Desulfobulbus sp.]|jgi:hypothetical protein|uniref:hypothetical protein n=1 Tax=Desulfobulbus sp. TaxID=895 RepID=UPI00283E648C|nr:hypothetical protein [Desulfobulbus sp.]MDR2549767.1 hypothetical protein [Desulfobulbus sp.]